MDLNEKCTTCGKTRAESEFFTICSNGFHYGPSPEVWVLARNCEHEPEEILGVYSSREIAEQMWREYQGQIDPCGRGDIEAFTLNGRPIEADDEDE